MTKQTSLAVELRTAWITQAQRSPFIFAGLAGSLLLILLAVVLSTLSAISQDNVLNMRYALVGGSAGFLATTAGPASRWSSGISLRPAGQHAGFCRRHDARRQRLLLILPGVEAGHLRQQLAGAATVVSAGLGVVLMLGLDSFIPHEHEVSGPMAGICAYQPGLALRAGHHSAQHSRGHGYGVGFSAGDMHVGVPSAAF